ncbi:MAG TPA: PHP domain-containing protein [Dehalococcoidia bacterium]|nr:PHP domain-containing protein [Dehalococcoidia bacterium]
MSTATWTKFVADFHLHSTFSDGILSPTDLVSLAADQGVTLMSLTDHDSTEGIAEATAACKAMGITLVPGSEVSTDIESDEVHVLGHFLDPADERLQAFLLRNREGRFDRGRRMVEQLNEIGITVSWERVQEIAGEAAIGRPHIAQALVEQGHVATVAEAFERFIGRNGPAYAERVKLTPRQAVEFIVSIGGIATFAHPQFTTSAREVLPDLVDAGLSGIEVYYKDLDQEAVEVYLALANQYDLIPMGGTDYHGLNNPGERLPGRQVTPWPKEAVDRLFSKAEQLGRLRLVS